KDEKAYLLDRSNLGGFGGSLVTERVSTYPIRTAPAAYRAADAMLVAFQGHGAPCPSGQGGDLTVLRIAASPRPALAAAWCGAVELCLARRHRRHEAQNAALSPLAEDEATLKAIAIDRLAECIGRLARMPVLDQFDAEQEATPAHIADLLVALRQGTEMALEAVADCARLRRHVLALDDIEAGDPGGAGER